MWRWLTQDSTPDWVANLKLVQKLLGHSSLDITNKYAHLLNADAVSAVDESLSDFKRRAIADAPPPAEAVVTVDSGKSKAEMDPRERRRKRA